MRRARLTRSWFGCDPVATQYAALWSAHFHRCFGPVLNERDVPADFRPLSCGDSCAALYNLHNDPTYPDTPSADFLRDCLPLMLFAGFRPRPERHHMVDTLLRRMDDRYALTVDDDADLALQYVLHDARRRYGAVPDNTPPLIDTMAAILPPDEISKQVISSPTAVKYEGHVWTITTELWIPVPVDAAAHLVNPENWTELGSFFTETTRLDAPKKSTKEGAQAWHGRLHETYTYNWSTLSVQSFHTVLKIDYTVGADKVRTDYSLEYEEDDQLIRSEERRVGKECRSG